MQEFIFPLALNASAINSIRVQINEYDNIHIAHIGVEANLHNYA